MLQAEPTSRGAGARISVGIPASEGSASVDVATVDRTSRKSPSTPALAPGQLRRRERRPGTLHAESRVQPMADVLDHIGGPSGDLVPESLGQPAEKPMPVVDPGFARLVRRGIRPSRARRMCEAAGSQDTTQGLVTAMTRALPATATGRAPSRVAVVGDSGSGKTSLILRAAMSRLKAGRRTPTVVIIAPAKEHLLGWQDPTPMFESLGLEVVRCSAEALESALAGLSGDVLVDTPASFSIPKSLRIHTRLVIDARSSGPATAREGHGADSVVLTHVDLTETLGYAAERLIAIDLPVVALVRSARPDSGMEAYSPRRLAQELCA